MPPARSRATKEFAMQYARTAMHTMIFVLAAALSSAAQATPAQAKPDAMDLLKNVELAYGAMNTYSAKVTSTLTMEESGAQGNVNLETPMNVTVDAWGKFRVETKGMMSMVMVNDGTTMWMYMPMANSYSKIPLEGPSASVTAGAMGAGTMRMRTAGSSLWSMRLPEPKQAPLRTPRWVP